MRPISVALLLAGLGSGVRPFPSARGAPDIICVKGGATGADNGSSWEDAYTDLQRALAAARGGDEIWVAGGSYQPSTGAERSATSQLRGGVALSGGSSGGETGREAGLEGQRDDAERGYSSRW